MISDKVGVGDLRDRPKHRSSCSTVEEDLAAATVMDGSTLPAIDALPSRNAISEAPRAAGYRGSDFVLWHVADEPGTSVGISRADDCRLRRAPDQPRRQTRLIIGIDAAHRGSLGVTDPQASTAGGWCADSDHRPARGCQRSAHDAPNLGRRLRPSLLRPCCEPVDRCSVEIADGGIRSSPSQSSA